MKKVCQRGLQGMELVGTQLKCSYECKKKLSIILGVMAQMGSDYSIVIVDDLYSELPLLNSQIDAWTIRVPSLQKRSWKFQIPGSQSRVAGAMGQHTTTQTVWRGKYHLIYFPNIPLEMPKASEWAKLETQQELGIASMLGENFDAARRGDVHIHMYTHIFTAKFFELFSVHTLGSAHNMMGVLSTWKDFPFASSNSVEDFWHFEILKLSAITLEAFITRVYAHNASRSSFFLCGKYYFNARLNLLRHLPGKSVDYVTGVMEDIGGIDVTASAISPEFAGFEEQKGGFEAFSDSDDDDGSGQDGDGAGDDQLGADGGDVCDPTVTSVTRVVVPDDHPMPERNVRRQPKQGGQPPPQEKVDDPVQQYDLGVVNDFT